MFIALEAAGRCVQCDHPNRWLLFTTVRVNKRSMRAQGNALFWRDVVNCDACGAEITHRPVDEAFRPCAEDAAKVRAYRLEKWPELAKEVAS